MSDVLFPNVARNFSTIAGVPSNIEAVETALMFSNANTNFVTLVGPSGWGKTHLMEATAGHMLFEHGVAPHMLTALELSANPYMSETPGVLMLDNVQDALDLPRTRQNLRLMLERRVRANRATFLSFTANKPTRQIKALLPGGREWQVAAISAPEPSERLVVLSQISQAEGVTISQGLAHLLAHKMRGNGRTLVGALKRLRLYGPTWLDTRSTLRACGILDPFFADNSAWDLKEQVVRAVYQPEFKHLSGIWDLALYVMLKEASLCEEDVARFAQMSSCEAYTGAVRFAKSLEHSEASKAQLNTFVEFVVDSLIRE